jgi:hypothetical protein
MSGTNTAGYQEAALSADGSVVALQAFLPAGDRRAMLPIEEVAELLSVSVALLKRQHLADPAGYPAERVGTLWRIPRWWVERKIACTKGATS